MKITKLERLREVLELLELTEGRALTMHERVGALTMHELVEICEAYKDSVVTELIETPTERLNP